MPHWRQDGATYFVTFRLFDSLPQSKVHELRGLKQEWERQHPKPHSCEVAEEWTREMVRRVENWLDQGSGHCFLREPSAATHVVGAMHYFADQRYEIGCYVVMPNHVHAVLRPTQPRVHTLETILKSWKSYSGKRINEDCDRSGELWQEESFDRIIRDEEHLWRTIQYVGRNPAKAGLDFQRCPLWINPVWESRGWTFQSAVL